VVVLIQHFLLFLHITSYSQLYLTRYTSADLSIDQDIPRSVGQSILDPYNNKRIARVIALLVESSKQVKNFALLGDALTA